MQCKNSFFGGMDIFNFSVTSTFPFFFYPIRQDSINVAGFVWFFFSCNLHVGQEAQGFVTEIIKSPNLFVNTSGCFPVTQNQLSVVHIYV